MKIKDLVGYFNSRNFLTIETVRGTVYLKSHDSNCIVSVSEHDDNIYYYYKSDGILDNSDILHQNTVYKLEQIVGSIVILG